MMQNTPKMTYNTPGKPSKCYEMSKCLKINCRMMQKQNWFLDTYGTKYEAKSDCKSITKHI